MNDERPPQAVDELALQNAIRKRYGSNWPATILELTKRVQAVNQTWWKITELVMRIPGLRIYWYREDDKLFVAVSISQHPEGGVAVEEVELHEITIDELVKARQYVEVLVMDKLDHSELIARHSQ